MIVTDVADGYAASGLVVTGDVILAIDGTSVTDEVQGRALARAALGKVVFSVLRGGAHVTLTADKPAVTTRLGVTMKNRMAQVQPNKNAAGMAVGTVERNVPKEMDNTFEWKERVPYWATTRALDIVSSGEETILGVWLVSDHERVNTVKQYLAQLVCLSSLSCAPCIFAPCMCACMHSVNEALTKVIYVLTDKTLYQSLDRPQTEQTREWISQGRDSGNIALEDINYIGTDLAGETCCQQCFPLAPVVLGLPSGHPLATTGGDMYSRRSHERGIRRPDIPHNKMRLMVDQPEQVMRMIHEAKDKAGPRFSGLAVAPIEMAR